MKSPHIFWTLWTLWSLGALAGCEASFVDQRPKPALMDAQAPDRGAMSDATATAGVFAAGTFEGRAGHGGEGTAELVRRADGMVVLRFGSDFAVSGVAAPVVVLSPRAELGRSIEPSQGDLHLGTLSRTRGPQSYSIPAGDGGRRYAWVFCEPFAVEIARARLEPKP